MAIVVHFYLLLGQLVSGVFKTLVLKFFNNLRDVEVTVIKVTWRYILFHKTTKLNNLIMIDSFSVIPTPKRKLNIYKDMF